jgi:hypothetical protein
VKADLCFGFSSTDWENLVQRLDNDEGAWSEVIGVFERRMKERFFTCIDALVEADTKPDLKSLGSPPEAHCIPGFSIMALCCLLVETLQGFRTGASPNTKEIFLKFLRRPAFGAAFAEDKIAECFVKGIRHGVLHEAETKKWVIWRSEPHGQIVAPEQDGHALNRTLFYDAVEQEFGSYLKELRDPSNDELRKRFRKKMGDICTGA